VGEPQRKTNYVAARFIIPQRTAGHHPAAMHQPTWLTVPSPIKGICEMEEIWRKWLRQQTQDDKNKILFAAIERLIEMDEVRFRIDDFVREDGTPIPEDEAIDECLYWETTGDDLRK